MAQVLNWGVTHLDSEMCDCRMPTMHRGIFFRSLFFRDTVAKAINPFSIGIGTSADVTSSMAQANIDAAAGWSVQQGLTVPLRSSIVRGEP